MHPMKKAMESLRWVAYEEVCVHAQSDSDDDVVRANDVSDSSESVRNNDRRVLAQNSDSDCSEELESDEG